MTQDENQQVAAAMKFMERQIAHLASEGAIVASQLEATAIRLKAVEEELAALKAPKVDGSN